MLVQRIVDTPKGLPASLEVQGVGFIDILLTLITETQTEVPFDLGYPSFCPSTKIEYMSLSCPLIREPNLIQRWWAGDTRPSLCVSCNTCYRTPGHQCVFNLRKK